MLPTTSTATNRAFNRKAGNCFTFTVSIWHRDLFVKFMLEEDDFELIDETTTADLVHFRFNWEDTFLYTLITAYRQAGFPYQLSTFNWEEPGEQAMAPSPN